MSGRTSGEVAILPAMEASSVGAFSSGEAGASRPILVEEDWSALDDLSAPLTGLLRMRARTERIGMNPVEIQAALDSLAKPA